MLFDKEDKRWEDKASDYEAYYNDHVHRILQREEIHSLDPPLHLPLNTPHMDAEQHQSNMSEA
jgi:hypothetical protein